MKGDNLKKHLMSKDWESRSDHLQQELGATLYD